MKKLPSTRNSNVVVHNAGHELLIYDLDINKAFCLNKTSTIIYGFCTGEVSFEEVERKTGFTEDVILLALDQLKRDNLIEGEEIVFAGGLTRRQVIRKIGLTTMVTLPLISSLLAPTAAQAASAAAATVCGTTCTGNRNCSSPCPTCFNSTAQCPNGTSCTNVGAACPDIPGTCGGPFNCPGNSSGACNASLLGQPCGGFGPCSGTCSGTGLPCTSAGSCTSPGGSCGSSGTCQA